MTEQEMIDEMVERDLHLFTLIEALEVVENIIRSVYSEMDSASIVERYNREFDNRSIH